MRRRKRRSRSSGSRSRYLVLQGYEPDAFAELVAALPRYELLAERRGVRLYRLGVERRPRTY